MSNALPRHMYGDPMEAAIRAEAKSCRGCAHEVVERWFGENRTICAKDKKHGTRCNRYTLKGRENV